MHLGGRALAQLAGVRLRTSPSIRGNTISNNISFFLGLFLKGIYFVMVTSKLTEAHSVKRGLHHRAVFRVTLFLSLPRPHSCKI